MDASTDVGHPIGKKSSSGYEPPELARVKYSHSGTELARADTSFDIWSLGVILYELSAGRTMFNQDTSNDQLVEEADEVRLCTWETISPERLAPVFVRHHDLAGNHLGCILLNMPAISLLAGRGRDPGAAGQRRQAYAALVPQGQPGRAPDGDAAAGAPAALPRRPRATPARDDLHL